jgi:hypothetical protein
MVHRKYFRVQAVLVLALALFFHGCRRDDSPVVIRVEQPVTTPAPPPPTAAAPAKLPPATEADVRSALKRVFSDDVRAAGTPEFVTGDFNGDGSEDLAVVVSPSPAKLGEINDELANWIVQDADRFFVAPSHKSVVSIPEKGERAKIGNEDVLAVIHGNGPMGWRSPDARQAYLLKHGAAAYTGKVQSFKQKEVRALGFPVKTEVLLGMRNQKPGVLFWTGSAYGWHATRQAQ